MTERTNEELADFAKRLGKYLVDSPTDWGLRGYAGNIADIETALRAMPPEGERIEGVSFLDGDNFCPEGDQPSWIVVPHCPHETKEEYPLSPPEYFATLILHERKEGES